MPDVSAVHITTATPGMTLAQKPRDDGRIPYTVKNTMKGYKKEVVVQKKTKRGTTPTGKPYFASRVRLDENGKPGKTTHKYTAVGKPGRTREKTTDGYGTRKTNRF